MIVKINDIMNSVCVEDMTNEQFNFILDAVASLMVKEEIDESEDDF